MSTITKQWKNVELSINLGDASYNLKMSQFQLDNCTALLEESQTVHKTKNWAIAENSQDKLTVGMESPIGKAKLSFSPALNRNNIAGVKIQFESELMKETDSVCLIPLRTPVLQADHVLEHGRSMGGCRMIKTPATTAFKSVFQAMITENGSHLQFTHPLLQKQLSDIRGEINGRQISDLTVTTHANPCDKKKTAAEPVSIFVSANGHEMMTAYGESERTPGKEVSYQAPGWNSWDYYRWTISEEEVLKNAAFIKNDPVLSKHIKRITIDDGWQYCYGEWDANPLFPHGMEYLAQKLTDMGFEPGIWIAPSAFEPHSRMAQVKTEMMATGVSGKPCLAFECMRRYGFILDPTCEDSRKWIYDLFSRYVDMGYKFFKLDFLGQTLKAKNFLDQSIPRGEIIGKIVEPIRAATKGKAVILGCNYNFEAGAQLVDSVRVSGDVHSDWNCIKENAPSISARFWSQGRLWDNDPDFALCRGPQTSDDTAINDLKPCLVFVTPDKTKKETIGTDNAFSSATLEEAKTLLGLVIISGGCVNLSDNLPALNKTGLELLRRTVSTERGEAGIPLDLFQSDHPSTWIQKTSSGHRILLTNWSDEEKSMSFDLKAHGIECSSVIDFWTDEPTETKNGGIVKKLKPHSSYLGTTHQYCKIIP